MSDERQSLKNRAVSKEISTDNPDLDTEEAVFELEISRTIRKAINDANWKIVKGQYHKDVSEVEIWRTFHTAISDANRRFVKGRHHQAIETPSALHLATPINVAEEEGEAGKVTQGYYIPIEIVANILARVFATPLQRFKCVSKQWYNLITSETFIQLHLQNQQMMYNTKKSFDQPRGTDVNGNGIHIFFCSIPYSRYASDSYKIHTLDLSSASSFGDQQRIPIVNELQRISKPNKYRTIPIGSCNGIVCLRNKWGTGFALFNPSNRTYSKLPSLKVEQDETHNGNRFVYGFGYDVPSDDYKVVRIFQCRSKSGLPSYDTTVMISSLRDKRWREFQDSTYQSQWGGIATYSNNMLHWVTVTRKDGSEDDHYVMLRFDLRIEKFDKAMFPLPIGSLIPGQADDIRILELADLHGIFLLIKTEWCQSDTDMWMMKEYGVNESWCKLCSVKNYVESLWPITLSKSGKEILVMRRYPECRDFAAWIDIATGNERTSYTLPTLPKDSSYYHKSHPYLPSLVNLNSQH